MTRDEFLARYADKDAPKVKEVPIEGHGTFHVRRISMGESLRLAPDRKAGNGEATGEATAEAWKVLLLCLSDPDGNRLLGDTPEDEATARSLDAMPFLLVANAAIEFNGLGKKDRVAELAKNS